MNHGFFISHFTIPSMHNSTTSRILIFFMRYIAIAIRYTIPSLILYLKCCHGYTVCITSTIAFIMCTTMVLCHYTIDRHAAEMKVCLSIFLLHVQTCACVCVRVCACVYVRVHIHVCMCVCVRFLMSLRGCLIWCSIAAVT